MELNLLPWREKRRYRFYRELAIIIVLPLSLCLCQLCYCYHLQNVKLNRYLLQQQNLTAQLRLLESQSENLDNSINKIRLATKAENPLQKQYAAQEKFIELFIYMGSLLPSGSYISSWQYDSINMRFEGESARVEQIMRLLQNLTATAMFHSLQIQNIQTKPQSESKHFVIIAKVDSDVGKN